ncbi:MAG: DVU0298 family protein [Bacillota bacterium]
MARVNREVVAALLGEGRISELAGILASDRGSMRYLTRLLYHPDDLMRWRAIEAVGEVADRLADVDPGAVRNMLRSLLWSINDESGGIGWSAPECIGEIVFRRPDMFGEFASIIISCADEEMLRRGVVWAAGRIARARPELVREDLPKLAGFLDDPDPVVRGYTLRLMAITGWKPDWERHRRLLTDMGRVPIYEDGIIKEYSVAELAAECG